MNFEELNDLIPFVNGGKEKILSMYPYNNITLLMPGRHANVSDGGDFCVCITDDAFENNNHQFTHTDLFTDIEKRKTSIYAWDREIASYYLRVVCGESPDNMGVPEGSGSLDTINRMTFLYAVQCLAVAEHRRYARFESKWGGRFLPFRFSAGIMENLWTANDAIALQRRGRPGVELLENQYGVPVLTSKLIESKNG